MKKNYDVVSLDNYSTGSKKNELQGVQYINADITNIDSLDKDFDLCFHLAAQSRVQPSFENPDESFRVNVLGTTKVMEFAKKNNICTAIVDKDVINNNIEYQDFISKKIRNFFNAIAPLTQYESSIGEMLIEHNHGFGQGRGSNSECSFNQAHLPHDTWLQAPCLGLSFA